MSKITVSADLANLSEGTHEIPLVLRYGGDAGVYQIELVEDTVSVELVDISTKTEGNE